MGRFQKTISLLTFFVMVLGLTVVASAQYRDQRRNNGNYGNRNIENSIKNLSNQSRSFQRTLDRELDRSRYDGSSREDNLNSLAKKFKNAAENLDDEYDGYRDFNKSRDEASKVLNLGSQMDRALTSSRIGRDSLAVSQQWTAVERNLIVIAREFNYNYRGTYGRNGNGRYNRNNRNDRNGNVDPYGNNRYPRDDRNGNNNRYGNARSIISSLKYKARNFEDRLDNDRYNRSRSLEGLSDRFKNAVDDLADDANDRDGGYDEVQKVLRIGEQLDGEIARSGVSRNVRREWNSIEGDLKNLARAYNVSYRGNNGRTSVGLGEIFRRLPF